MNKLDEMISGLPEAAKEYIKNKKLDEVEIKERKKPTLNKSQKLFHFLQRSVASKGYLETVSYTHLTLPTNREV